MFNFTIVVFDGTSPTFYFTNTSGWNTSSSNDPETLTTKDESVRMIEWQGLINQKERTWQESAMAYFKVFAWICLKGRRKTRHALVVVTIVPAQIRTKHLLHTTRTHSWGGRQNIYHQWWLSLFSSVPPAKQRHNRFHSHPFQDMQSSGWVNRTLDYH